MSEIKIKNQIPVNNNIKNNKKEKYSDTSDTIDIIKKSIINQTFDQLKSLFPQELATLPEDFDTKLLISAKHSDSLILNRSLLEKYLNLDKSQINKKVIGYICYLIAKSNQMINLYDDKQNHLFSITDYNLLHIGQEEARLPNLKDLKELSDGNKIDDILILFKKKYPELYEKSVGVSQGYTLFEHTKMVLDQWKKYFNNQNLLQIALSKLNFILLLTLHDAGKPLACKYEDKNAQHRYTSLTIKPILEGLIKQQRNKQNDKSEIDLNIIIKLLESDILGKYIRYGEIEKATQEIDKYAKESKISSSDFLILLYIYYMCDASSYTRDAGGDGKSSIDEIYIFDKGVMRFTLEKENLMKALFTHYVIDEKTVASLLSRQKDDVIK
jgi:hypothetical protein